MDTLVRFYNQHTMLTSAAGFGIAATLGTRLISKSWKTSLIVGAVVAAGYAIRFKMQQPNATL